MAGSTITFWRRPFFIAAVSFLVVLGVFLPCLWNDFINFDDPTYVTSNFHIRSGLTWSAVRWAFSSIYAANWHPLTWLSHMLDVQLFGKQPWGHHLTSVLLHSANTALLALVLTKATGSIWRSVLVALLFGIHPLHVESVAWVAERKDVLNTFFSLLTLLAYVRWVQTNNSGQRATGWYIVALVCFALSLGSKAMSVTLPVLLLLLDYWPLRRFHSQRGVQRAVIEKIPLFILSLAASGITIAAQKSGGAIDVVVPLWARSCNAAVSILQYLLKLVWPNDLAVFYPYSLATLPLIVFGAAFAITASAAAILYRRQAPWLFTGWFWFVISLLPVIGLVQIGGQAMADRYMYLPSIGPLVAIVWAPGQFSKTAPASRPLLASAFGVVAIALTALTERQISVWKSSETVFHHALAVTRRNALAHLNLGAALGNRGAHSEALFHMGEAVRIDPDDADSRVNLGMALDQNGRRPEAIPQFEAAIQLKPDYAKAHANLAVALQEENDLERAMNEYREALRLDSVAPELRVGFGLALQRSGQIDAALGQFEEAIKEDPGFAGAHSNRGIVLEKLERLEEAISAYRKALSLDPKNSDAALNLPVALFKANHADEAIDEARKLIKQRPDYAEAYFNLGGMLHSKKDFDGAISAYRKALELKPNYADALHNLKVALEDKAAAKH